jgi:hypothetical protein
MRFSCFLGKHVPFASSIARRPDRLVAYCDECARPLVKVGDQPWQAAAPLDEPIGDLRSR